MFPYKLASRWYSTRLRQEVLVARFGYYGQPLLLFPTAGGDAEESERFLMMRALRPLIEGGRIKVYSCDSVAGRTWLDPNASGLERAAMQNAYHHFVVNEVVPAIRQDCRSPEIPIMTAGASLGAYNALAAITRAPEIFSHAICMSGTFDIQRWSKGQHSLDLYFSSPLHFLPNLPEGEQLNKLRERFILLATGDGRWEEPEQSHRVAHVLAAKQIPHRVDIWHDWDHDWITWRDMLPKYLDKMVP
ncbi:MAG: hypothetical protein H6728_12800 [Myxococcales bacterium]|nr:hypothetical protein [Myxococcales bacterium]MCB9643947.1 hypothetical protein [Myxococcales bacterium]